MTVSLLFFYGCDNEGSEFQNKDQNNLLLDVEWQLHNIDGKGQSKAGNSFYFEDLQGKIEPQGSFKTPSNHANGHFNTQEGNKITFSSGGDDELGVWKISGNINFEGFVHCATVEGNQAVVQMVITELGDNPEGFPFNVGGTILYLLEDNGEGANAPDDQYFNFVLAAPFDFGTCIELSPSDYLGIFEGCECGAAWFDTAKKSDQIQIK